ncbi:rhodanese-like domain-containing protein [Aldersonia sp. NBC_00410]|uniref:rhodanese-like domain-containing protein n=1 Tax=Aldersonia sp. NBC_00410 TaxID=2975954 RepID=UPI00225773D2|nr:rhodanese-like domain-containing protein [Aldersonia sp. NBC_00410]MCX5043489.1 rhodanese-like domain-containing protein [Aldersonia sp. NBC_00410]
MPTHIAGHTLLALDSTPRTELAILDLRSPLERTTGQIAVSTGVPYHDLEQRISELVPHLDTTIVLAGTPDLDEVGAAILEQLGYTDVRVVDDGIRGWTAAGGRTYTGTNVRSKTLGEWIEHTFATPTVDSDTVQSWLDNEEDIVILDSRPSGEYLHHHIPGGYNTGGGAEIDYRAGQVVTTPHTKVVINCAGRTRGIVGAQSLINTGIPNQVFSLYNGTPAWEQSGRPLAFGRGADLDAPQQVSAELVDWVESTLAQAGARIVGAEEVRHQLDNRSVTTYVFDVRSPAEFRQGHLDAAISVPGGQLVQTIDEHVAVHGAHIVLVDTGEFVRAASTVQWLRYLHSGPITVVAASEAEVRRAEGRFPIPEVAHVTVADIAAWRSAGRDVRILDLRSSTRYAAGHIAESIHARREHIPQIVEGAPDATVVLVGDETYAPEYAAAAGPGNIAVLSGGIDAVADSLTTEAPRYAAGIEDHTGPPPFGPDRDRWYAAYFEWELSLLDDTAGDPHFDFEQIASSKLDLPSSATS